MATTTESTPIDWNTANTMGLVQIPTHKMFLRAAGPARKPGEPVVIVEGGHGSASCHYVVIAKQIAEFARIYTYDRSGLGDSEISPLARKGEHISKELKLLLEAAKIEPPYILISHSYGGVLVREFLELELKEGKDRVVGAVFEECNTEYSYKGRPEQFFQVLDVMMDGLDQNKILDMDNRHKMTHEEWEVAKRDTPVPEQAVCGQEAEFYFSSCDALAEHKQFERKVLGEWPVSVIKGDNEKETRKLFDEAVRQGKGTEKERNTFLAFVSEEGEANELKMMERQLELSDLGRVVRARKSGHNVHLTEPELITEEVRWVLSVWEEKKGKKEKA